MSFVGKSSRQKFEEGARATAFAYMDMLIEKGAEVQHFLKMLPPEIINPKLLIKADYGYGAISPEFSFSMKNQSTGTVEEFTHGLRALFSIVRVGGDMYPAGTLDVLKKLQKVSDKLENLWSLEKDSSDFMTIAQNEYSVQLHFKILGEKFKFIRS